MNTKRIYKDPFYVKCKKHYCPTCGTRLRVMNVSKIVNSKSLEAKNYDFHSVDNYLIGDVKFIWNEFECPMCKRRLSIDAMKRIENVHSNVSILPTLLMSFLVAVFICTAVFGGKTTSYIQSSNPNQEIPVKDIYTAGPFYLYFKKHFCLECGEKLTIGYDSVIVNSESPEAENYDFSSGDMQLVGNVEFRIACFKCPECEFNISFEEMEKYEKKEKSK